MRCQRHGTEIARYFEGQLDATGEANMRARLTECEACRAHYERHLVVEAALLGTGAATERLWRGVRSAAGRAQSAGGAPADAALVMALPPSKPRRFALAGAVLSAAAILLIALPRLGHTPERRSVSAPVARGGASPAPALHVFRSVSEHAAEPLVAGAPIHAREGLLFAYSNFDASLTRFMAFAIDADYGVHWYYPAFEHAGEDPQAISIATGRAGVELGEEIRHDLPPGPLRVVGLFLREPHGVREIEALVKARIAVGRGPLSGAAPLAIPGSVEVSTMLRVVP
jgi:hypothetical protein